MVYDVCDVCVCVCEERGLALNRNQLLPPLQTCAHPSIILPGLRSCTARAPGSTRYPLSHRPTHHPCQKPVCGERSSLPRFDSSCGSCGIKGLAAGEAGDGEGRVGEQATRAGEGCGHAPFVHVEVQPKEALQPGPR